MVSAIECIKEMNQILTTRTMEHYSLGGGQFAPTKIRPDLESFLRNIQESALERIANDKTPTPSTQSDPALIAVEEAFVAGYTKLLYPEKGQKESYDNLGDFLVNIIELPKLAEWLVSIKDALTAMVPRLSQDKNSYDAVGRAWIQGAQALINEVGKSYRISHIYDISYQLYYIHDETKYEPTDKTRVMNQGLTNPDKNTYLGRKPKEGSIFSDLGNIFSMDISVSREHLFFSETSKGFELNDISVGGTAGKDYQGKDFKKKRPDHKNRDPLNQLLVPIGYNGPKFEIPINFGGDKQNKYQLKLTFTPKKQAK